MTFLYLNETGPNFFPFFGNLSNILTKKAKVLNPIQKIKKASCLDA
jgi:hypothetical protein